MFKIIGGDGKEYGPVTLEQIRQWINQGRANGQTMVQAEGSSEWKPLSAYPEFADLAGPSTPSSALPPTEAAPPTIDEVIARDYDLNIGSCIARSWETVKQNFWPVVGFSLLVVLANAAVNEIIGLPSRSAVDDMIRNLDFTPGGTLLVFLTLWISAPFQTIFMGGLVAYYLKLIRGQPAGLADAFSGFTLAPGQLALLGALNFVLVILGTAACILPGIYLSVAWIFSTALVVDRRLGVWEALETSRKVVTRHWFVVFAFLVVIGLLGASGLIACCVGVFVTMPICTMALMYAYEDIFSQRSQTAP